ncbi:unnamed protein product [Amoebophrya sp. A25]|nr:unnamed protein product [Amoebophrya sp. A25]|eukprot:GSA25T00002327001.1
MPELVISPTADGATLSKGIVVNTEDDFEDIVDDHDDLGCGSDDDFCIEGDASEGAFDEIVGALEDIVIGDPFQKLMKEFSDTHCGTFEDTEENKLEYMDIFSKWTTSIEGFLEKNLKFAIPGFVMKDFIEMLSERKNIEEEIVEEVLELLLSVNDFETFKQMMLTHKKSRPRAASLAVSGRGARIYKDEEEDGTHQPDLDFAICGTKK